jgi:hypothetical protein
MNNYGWDTESIVGIQHRKYNLHPEAIIAARVKKI